MLKHDQGAVSAPDRYGNLPLHIASEKQWLEAVELIFDKYPEAIFVENNASRSPFHVAGDHADNYKESEVVDFLFLWRQHDIVRHSHEQSKCIFGHQLPLHWALRHRAVPVGTIKLMAAAHPRSLTFVDNEGYIPLHIACQASEFDIVKCLVEQKKDCLEIADGQGNLALHHVSLVGYCDVINYILEESDYGATKQNVDKKLPVQLLLYDSDCNRNSLEYVESIFRLLRVDPVETLVILAEENFHDP